jgi:2-polyprenyl-3-methyl-5-hydroxy-6-metoxy-1,4-benzoquinol methylase
LSVLGAIDTPAEDELVFQHGFEVSGWAQFSDERPWTCVAVDIGSANIGSTWLPFARPDVADDLQQEHANVGFVAHCVVAESLRSGQSVELQVRVADADGQWSVLGTRTVRYSEIDYRIHGLGKIVSDEAPRVYSRDEIYASGQPSPFADPVCTGLIMRYLRTGETVLDVGCGVGAYYRALMPFGLDWTGCEAQPDLVARMRAEGLPASLASKPFAYDDCSFDATICIEVLEHVEDYEDFLAECSRVSRRVAIFSVPNFGAVPITSSIYALPYHMLEPDHRNFFTTRSLSALLGRYYRHVETFEYGPLALLKSHDGIPINNHVFAVAFH